MELTDRELAVLNQLEMLVRQGKSAEEAAATLRAILGGDAGLVDRVLTFRTEVAEERRRIASGRSLFDPEDEGSPWYTGPGPEDKFWPTLKALLSNDPSWASAVQSLDDSSTDIVSLLADPHSPRIGTRGLVLGFVQSGKTANFTASIAKAADAGYRLFIVLSGVHNSLRRQTQLRIDQHLVELCPADWVGLTDEQRDFGSPVKALPLLRSPNLRMIAVVKKNVSRLTRLRDWLYEAHKHGGLDSCPVLIIDDEADQASPNASKNPDLDRTRINERLKELLQLPRVAYVGYTATPFANVLVNPADEADIYPRSFVYSLPKPTTYFGSRELFGQLVSEEEASPDDVAHDMIRIVSADEATKHSKKTLQSENPVVTPCLAEAISWFVLATAARRFRAGSPKHSSMLIHTTMRVDPQFRYVQPIKDFLAGLKAKVLSRDFEDLRTLWEIETGLEPAERHQLTPVGFADLESLLPIVLGDLNVLVDNGSSTERLVYDDEPATVIAIGGNTLSRGLTLEGLVSSYFLRSSNTYDTLLQMGRWFGYRPGYSDLPRIWTTKELAADFEFLAEVEDSIRIEIERYRSVDGATPLNLPVRIRLHPKMRATSQLKMHYAVNGDSSFSAQRPQTTVFAHRDLEVIKANQEAARALLTSALGEGVTDEYEASRTILHDVPVRLILDFIQGYRFHEDSEMSTSLLTRYISSQNDAGALGTWNVAVIGRREPKERIPLGLTKSSPLIDRSKLKRSSDSERAVIGTLMSKPDRVADIVPASSVKPETSDTHMQALRDADRRGLLVLYPIDKDSQPKKSVAGRLPLDALDHLIGAAFCFPTAAAGTEPQNTIHVDLTHVSSESPDLDYLDEEGDRDEVDLDN